jgi:DNA gyrase subunit A
MKTAYIDYSMSVIVSRALPDVRWFETSTSKSTLECMIWELTQDRPTKVSKNCREVLGKYHPHGDTSVYDAMVRMVSEWSMRYLIDGQGNFGSVDGDSPSDALYRSQNARFRRNLADIDKETVDFKLNFDDTLEEPTVCQHGFLLINMEQRNCSRYGN